MIQQWQPGYQATVAWQPEAVGSSVLDLLSHVLLQAWWLGLIGYQKLSGPHTLPVAELPSVSCCSGAGTVYIMAQCAQTSLFSHQVA
jgi:hypothetical protein